MDWDVTYEHEFEDKTRDTERSASSPWTATRCAFRAPAVWFRRSGNTAGLSVSTGTFNAQQQSDVRAYWEFNRGHI
jgi:hypothetical protein